MKKEAPSFTFRVRIVTKRPVITGHPGEGGGAPWRGGLPGKGRPGGFCLRHNKIHLIPSHWQLISSQFFVFPPSVPPEDYVIRPQNPLLLAPGYKL